MKHLFLLCLLLNAVLYLWETGAGRSPAAQRQTQAAPATSAERIVLISELAETPLRPPEPAEAPPPVLSEQPSGNPPPAAASQPDPAAQPSPQAAMPTAETAKPPSPSPVPAEPQAAAAGQTEEAAAQTCHQLGPYPTLRQAQAALRRLDARLGQIKAVKKPTRVENGYMIFYPPADTWGAAQANRKMLAEKGYADAWVIDNGENRLAVSLAVTSSKTRADEALGRLHVQGIEAELKPRMALTDKWWLEAHNEADRSSLASIVDDGKGEILKICE